MRASTLPPAPPPHPTHPPLTPLGLRAHLLRLRQEDPAPPSGFGRVLQSDGVAPRAGRRRQRRRQVPPDAARGGRARGFRRGGEAADRQGREDPGGGQGIFFLMILDGGRERERDRAEKEGERERELIEERKKGKTKKRKLTFFPPPLSPPHTHPAHRPQRLLARRRHPPPFPGPHPRHRLGDRALDPRARGKARRGRVRRRLPRPVARHRRRGESPQGLFRHRARGLQVRNRGPA